MTKRLRALALPGVPIAVAGFSAALYPGQRPTILFVAVVVGLSALGIALLWWIAAATRGHGPLAGLFGMRSERRPRPADLSSLERMLGWQVYSEPEFNHRVRPVLRSILRARLLEERGLDPDTTPASSVEVPGALRPLLEVHPSRRDDAPPIRTRDLSVMVDELERL